MTERFKIGLDLITIEDTSKEYGALNQDEVVDELNRLNDENEQLRKENEKLESLWEDKCIKEYMKIVGENALQEMHNEKYGDK